MTPVHILLRSPTAGWRAFSDPVATFEARTPAEVRPCLLAVERAVADRGCTAAGYLAYEAAAAFGFRTHAPAADGLPLVWFGLFRPGTITPAGLPGGDEAYEAGAWSPSVDEAGHARRVHAVKRHIEAGDAYQINLTFRMQASFTGSTRALFRDLYEAQRGPWSAYLEIGRHVICSASPELFFATRNGAVVSEPMKGTAPRGLHPVADRNQGLSLRRSEKDRAENVMIVDVVRNDLGRVAAIGSVRTPRLFEVSRYPTLWQMTSAVTARSAAPFSGLIEALFPAASITGAPKIRAAELIHTLEDTPRGVYTGAIGCLEPGGLSHFNVPIRTITVDRERGTAIFGVGSGVVWDSRAEHEYEECCLKAGVLTARRPPFDLLETLAWSPGDGFELLPQHLQRLRLSAAYFGIRCDTGRVRQVLESAVHGCTERMKIRLLVDTEGRCRCSAEPIGPAPAGAARVALARTPVDPREIWLYHKTTRRQTYDEARATRPDCDEVILWNAAGAVTEGTTTNVVVDIGGRKVTPPVDAGLLAGTFRGWLLARGEIEERPVHLEQLREAGRLWIVNSVRRWRQAVLVG